MTLAAFLSVWAIHLVAVMSPGPAFVVCLRTAASEGFRTAAGVALGLALAVVAWAAATMAGLALLFQVAPWLFVGLKVVGALFLLWIAVQMWRHAPEPLPVVEPGAAPRGWWSAVAMGFLTNATNPKTAVFFGAVFVGLVPAHTPLWQRALLLGILFANEVVWDVLVARVFSLARARSAYARMKAAVDRTFGGLIALFGLKIALT